MVADTIQVSVVTPEREALAAEATFAAFPAYDGEMGVLPGRAPLLTQLGSGLLRLRQAGGGERTLFVSGGFAQVVENKLTLLTEEAREPATLDRAAADAALAEAERLPAQGERDFEKKRRAAERARTIRRLAKGL